MQEAVKGVGGFERWKEAVKGQETVKGAGGCGGVGGWEGKAIRLKENDNYVERYNPEPGRPWGLARRKGELTRWLGRWGSGGLNK